MQPVDLALVWRADETNPAVLAVLDVLSAGSPVALSDSDEVDR